jgi:hypothetical protein
VDAAEAWKAVSLVNDWVRHAETKSAGILAFSGVVGGVLYNLIKSPADFDCWVRLGASTCGLFVFVAAVCASCALWPRLAAREPATSVLYFEHIAREHPGSPEDYIKRLKEVLSSSDALVEQLGQQVWANARVARKKFTWAGYALVSLLVAVAGLTIVVCDLALRSI